MQQLCLVRIHKFSYLDKDETDSEKSASFKAMTDFAMQDGRVKEQTLTDKEKAVYEEFSVLMTMTIHRGISICL